MNPGDFKRSRGGGLYPAMRRFSKVKEELELRDIPLLGVLHLEWWVE